MKVNQTKASIDLALHLSSSLFSGTQLQRFQQSLIQFAPEWASELHLSRFGEPCLPIDATREGAIQDVALNKGLERGLLFQRLEQSYPSPRPSRRFGSLELRGANLGLTVKADRSVANSLYRNLSAAFRHHYGRSGRRSMLRRCTSRLDQGPVLSSISLSAYCLLLVPRGAHGLEP